MAHSVGLMEFAQAGWTSLRREASSTVHAMGLAPLFQSGAGQQEALAYALDDPYGPDGEHGDSICDGRFSLAGDQLIARDGSDIWEMLTPSRAFAEQLHGHVWLRDVVSAPNHDGATEARRLVDTWVAKHGRWNSFIWSPSVMSLRVMNWLRAGETLFGDAAGDADNTRRRRSLLARQAKHLLRTLPIAEDGRIRLRAALAATITGLCLPGQTALQRAGMTAVAAEVTRQILPDGGHVSRAPQATAEALIDLQGLVDIAEMSGIPVPTEISRGIARLRAMVRFFQMADGGLASFHGGGEFDRGAVDHALTRTDEPIKPFGFAPHSGYHRTEAEGATVLFDVGDAPRGELSTEAHASALSIEFCTPGGRLVVNCGWHDAQTSDWREAVRATAAHSTLVLGEVSSSKILAGSWQREMMGARLVAPKGQVSARRNEGEMGIWLEGSQEGYRDRYGLSHRRRIFLAADGGDLRGEDALFRPVTDGPPDDIEVRFPFAIRFHLHPSVRASLSRDNMSALLVQTNGDGWRFRTDGGPISLERSVYLAAGAPPQRATQIVIHGEAEPFGAGDRPPNRVRWAFQRLGRIGGAVGGIE
ncbi:heparinase II/III family protein [Maricaulis sp.]|uniref:heparinase II/III family protein n=1 Tax=Maricaulis sp. TaxID=1486257 RepID=UPI001B12DE1B|nr:heparinase II/III family protein [Maricaulis sp.]MBO6795801.1 heparinase II/III family protein [Maricaulis sp.]